MKYKKFDSEILSEIKKLYVYDNWHAVFALLLDYSLIIFAIYIYHFSYYLLPISLLIIGSRQRALATILHEASHSALTKNKKIGKFLGTYFSGYLIFQSWDSYYISHVKNHHPKLGSNEDPDYQYYLATGIFQEQTKTQFFWKFLFSHFLCLKILESLKYLLLNRLIISTSKVELVKIGIVQIILFTIMSRFIGAEGYFLFWLLPYLTTFQMITWFELSEHYPMIKNAEINLASSRNRFSHPIEQFFTGMHAENYHLIHHLFPAIPFWNLKKAHEILLKDEEYRIINEKFGGIFFSKNKNDSMWRVLWKNF